MITINGRKYIGLFKGLPYGDYNESIEDYKRDNCLIDRKLIINRFKSLTGAYTSEPTYDIFTGEQFPAGLCADGDFIFTTT